MKIRSFRKEPKKARIEIVPMIDTMFFLLVFFMIATLSMTVMRGMPVNLPKSESAKNDIKENITLTIEKDGGVFLDKTRVDGAALAQMLHDEAAANPDVLVILNADEDTSHGKVVEVIDEVKLAGISKFAIATRPRQ